MADQQSTPAPMEGTEDRFHTLMKEAKERSHYLQLALALSRHEIPGSGALMEALLTIRNEVATFSAVSRSHPVPWELLCMVLGEIVNRLRAVDKIIAEHLDSEGAREG